MRSLFVSACIATTICTGIAVAQSPVAYVYVAQTINGDNQPFPSEAVFAYSVTSEGKLTRIEGSPFSEVTGVMIGTTGTHFITSAFLSNPTFGDPPVPYLYSYEVASNGAIGKQESDLETSSCGENEGGVDGAELDHTGDYIYVPNCGNTLQTYKIAKPSGHLTFQSSTNDDSVLIYNTPGEFYTNPVPMTAGLPKLTGNSAYAYAAAYVDNGPNTPSAVFADFARESNGSLEYRGLTKVTGPTQLPANYYYTSYAQVTNDPTDHLAAMLQIYTPAGNIGCALASFTSGSDGQLTSTNTYDQLPKLPYCGNGMLLSPNGKVLAVLGGGGHSLQFFHFNGSEPITPLAQVSGPSGDAFEIMAWDGNNHLYALTSISGDLHVFTVSSTGVVEAAGSPYAVSYCGYDQPDSMAECYQNLVVRIIPPAKSPSI